MFKEVMELVRIYEDLVQDVEMDDEDRPESLTITVRLDDDLEKLTHQLSELIVELRKLKVAA